jgi:hypothetical protein
MWMVVWMSLEVKIEENVKVVCHGFMFSFIKMGCSLLGSGINNPLPPVLPGKIFKNTVILVC